MLAGAAAGAAYYHRADIETSYGALTGHMQYVGALWDKAALAERIRHLVEGETTHGVVFRMFYTLLPPMAPANPSPRTFCLLPEGSSDAFQRFVPARNTLAENEVRAHVSMFSPAKNDGYYQLGLEAAGVIRQAIANRRPVNHATIAKPAVDVPMDDRDGDRDQQGDTSTGESSDLLL